MEKGDPTLNIVLARIHDEYPEVHHENQPGLLWVNRQLVTIPGGKCRLQKGKPALTSDHKDVGSRLDNLIIRLIEQ